MSLSLWMHCDAATLQALLKFGSAVPAINQVRVAINQAWRYQSAFAVMLSTALHF